MCFYNFKKLDIDKVPTIYVNERFEKVETEIQDGEVVLRMTEACVLFQSLLRTLYIVQNFSLKKSFQVK